MKIIDFLLADHKKRVLFIFILIQLLMLKEFYCDGLLGLRLAKCLNVTDLLQLANENIVYSSIIGRSIINYLYFGNLEAGLLKIIGGTITWGNLAAIVLVIILMSNNDETKEGFSYLLNTLIQLIIMLVSYFAAGYFVYLAATSGSDLMVRTNLNMAGRIMLISGSGLVIYCIVNMVLNSLRGYFGLDI